MTKLEKARLSINTADESIAQYFEMRMHAAEDVVAYKMENNLPIFDGAREKEVIEKNLAKIQDEKLKPYYKDMIIQLMRISKEYQNAILHQGVYGYQGSEGAFSHIATGRLFPNGKQQSFARFEDVFKAVENHNIEKGVLPFENSTTGEVGEIMDLLYRYDGVKIAAFYDLKVEQNLMGVKGASLADVKKVYSKLEAIEQCENALKAFDFELVPYPNTALAAKHVAQAGDKTVAAIAAKESADVYGLDILMENINTSSDNVTRFIVVQDTLPKESDIVMAMFTVNHESGALAKIMQIIAYYNLNMTSIRSRACKDKSWQYYFYMEVEADIANPVLAKCFEECSSHCEQFKVIGCVKEVK